MKSRAFLFILALSAPALAYLDPVTGNLLVQAVLAGVAALALGYHRVKAYLGSLFGKKKKAEPKSEDKPPAEQPPEDEADNASQPDHDQAAVK